MVCFSRSFSGKRFKKGERNICVSEIDNMEVREHGSSSSSRDGDQTATAKMDVKGNSVTLFAQRLLAQIVKWKQVSLVTTLVVFLAFQLQYWGMLLLLLACLPLGGWAAHKIVLANKLLQSDNILNIWNSLSALVSHGDATHSDGSTPQRKQSITVNSELKEFVQNVMRDFILTWYGQLSEDEQFTAELFNQLEDLAVGLTKRFSRVSQYEIAEHCLRQFHKHYHTYNLARSELGVNTAPIKQTAQPTIPESDFSKAYFLFTTEHVATRNSQFEMQYLQSVVKALTKLILPKMMFDCKVGRKLLQEIITYKVIYAVINLLTEEDFLYRAIVRILSEGPNPKLTDCIDDVERSRSFSRSSRSGSIRSNSDTARKRSTSRGSEKDSVRITQSKDCAGGVVCDDKPVEKPGQPGKGILKNVAPVCQNVDVHPHKDTGESSGNSEQVNVSMSADQKHSNVETDSDSESKAVRNVPTTLEGLKSNTKTSTGSGRNSSNSSSPNTPFEDINLAEAIMHETAQNQVIKVGKADVVPSPTKKSQGQTQTSVSGKVKITNPEMLQDRTYHDVHLPETTVATEYRSTKEYTLYVVKYSTVNSEDQTELEVHEVKRRYREFLNLHSRLEDNAQLKKHLKDLKEPNRLFTLPVGNMNKDYVEHRRHFLEVYLQGLLSKQDIHRSIELKEFLAYGSDPHIAYVKKAPNMVPRFDKMFVRGVSGIFDTIKTALPNVSGSESQEQSKAEEDLSMNDALEAEQEATNSRMFAFPEVMYHSPVESMMEMYQNEIDYMSDGWHTWQLSRDQVDSAPKVLGPRPQGDGCDINDATKEQGLSTSEIQLATLTQHLLCETFQNCENDWLVTDQIQQILTVVTGKMFNSWLTLKIGELTTPEKWAYYLFKLREAVWEKKTTTPRTETEKRQTKKHAHECLVDFFPTLLRTSVGEEEYRGALFDAMESLQYPRLNRHFIYVMLDIALEMVAPEIKTVQLQEDLLKKSNGSRRNKQEKDLM
ncbi:sorting nexin-19-like [Ptychodera flava]|uniref:sorting nexin-19-like n=1 Tax=Ptychodera flava TaxID=63121 RepID=UPI003969DD1B